MKLNFGHFENVFLIVLTTAVGLGIYYFLNDTSVPDIKVHYAPFVLIPSCFLAVATGVVTFFNNKTAGRKGKIAYGMVLMTVTSVLSFASIYRVTGLNKGSEFIKNPDPIDCLYFSVVTWTTLGYGDFTPSEGTKYIVIFEAILGYVAMSLLVAVFIKLLDGDSIRRR